MSRNLFERASCPNRVSDRSGAARYGLLRRPTSAAPYAYLPLLSHELCRVRRDGALGPGATQIELASLAYQLGP